MPTPAPALLTPPETGTALRQVLLTALAYALTGAAALMLAGPPGYASPLFPSAGVALAAVLVAGPAALAGVWLGSVVVNIGLAVLHAPGMAPALLLPLVIGAGAALQAGAGAWLVRRYVGQPLVLNTPRDVLRFGVLGAMVASCVSPSVGTLVLTAAGALAPDGALSNWLNWWVGDTLGVLIGAPLVLSVIGQPAADWRPRRRTMGAPLLLALGLLAAGIAVVNMLERQRLQTSFERDADRLASDIQSRMTVSLHAIRALRAAARIRVPMDEPALVLAASGWTAQTGPLQAMGYSERVADAAVAAFEAQARAQGLVGYRVQERDGGAARREAGEVVAVRLITPLAGNEAALGVNSLSVPQARDAIARTRASGEPAVSAAFRLVQSTDDEAGIVLYQALYRGEPADAVARQAQFRGVVFVTVQMARALAGLGLAVQPYLRWCLVDPEPGSLRSRLAGPAGCETAAAVGPGALNTRRELDFGGRRFELRVGAMAGALPGYQREGVWLLTIMGLAAAAMLGALLLTITGHNRRTQQAVIEGTTELRREFAERLLAEAALRESESRLRSILDNAPVGVMFLDPLGYLIESNPRLCEMVARGAADLRGRSVVELLHPDEGSRLRALRRELIAGSNNEVLEPLRLHRAPGDELMVRASVSALRGPGGSLVRMVCVLEDITEHIRLLTSERALQRAEAANRAKSEFVSRMSHELRTPLNAVLGFAQLLGLDGDHNLTPAQHEWTAQIQRAGWHLLEMINETLDLARIESGSVELSLQATALPPLTAACCAMLHAPAARRGITISESVADDAAVVVADATRLKQVLTNLLSNAVKYNRDGGSVALGARRVRPAHGGVMVEITVADTGLGMTAEQQAALFQAYNRLGREGSGIEGTGIGLVISRRLAELMGGTLQATSVAGMGSIFTLRLPAADSAEAAPARHTETSPAPYRERLVHYVEDNATNIEVMRGVFVRRPQIRLEVSMLGLDGLAAIRATRPDLVLLDMQLPDISGLELLRHLKQDDSVADIPVMVVSADATPDNIEKALTAGAQHYVTKPLDVARFVQLVDGVLERADTRWS